MSPTSASGYLEIFAQSADGGLSGCALSGAATTEALNIAPLRVKANAVKVMGLSRISLPCSLPAGLPPALTSPAWAAAYSPSTCRSE